jgi:hypothetical protein
MSKRKYARRDFGHVYTGRGEMTGLEMR